MRVLLNPVFLLCLVIFFTEQLLESFGIFIPYIHAYIDDICAMPVLLTLASFLMSVIYYGHQSKVFSYRLSLLQVIFALIYCSVLFEFILPRYASKYVADYWDMAAYSLGALIYYRFINPARSLAVK